MKVFWKVSLRRFAAYRHKVSRIDVAYFIRTITVGRVQKSDFALRKRSWTLHDVFDSPRKLAQPTPPPPFSKCTLRNLKKILRTRLQLFSAYLSYIRSLCNPLRWVVSAWTMREGEGGTVRFIISAVLEQWPATDISFLFVHSVIIQRQKYKRKKRFVNFHW